MKDNDLELVTRARKGDRAALEVLWERERPWLAALVYSRCLDREIAADLLQEAALILVGRLTELREPAALRGWLKRAVVNRLNDVLRKRLVGPAIDPGSDPARLAAPRPAGDLGGYAAALAELPVDLREPLVLRAVDGLGVAEIAAILETSVTTIETRLVRGRRLLRERLERNRDAEEAGRRIGERR